jgi:hypothetical protein
MKYFVISLVNPNVQWEFQDPKMEVLYHIRPYFVGISHYISLIKALYMEGTCNKSVPEMAIEMLTKLCSPTQLS